MYQPSIKVKAKMILKSSFFTKYFFNLPSIGRYFTMKHVLLKPETKDGLPEGAIYFSVPDRNKEPILSKLKAYIKGEDHILELSSGTGQHINYFATQLPNCTWYPSEFEDLNLKSISAYNKELKNVILPPLKLDITKQEDWASLKIFDIISITNVLHITSFDVSLKLFEYSTKHIKEGGYLCIYGPFKKEGKFNSKGNEEFDIQLKQRDPEWGYRDIEKLEQVAKGRGLQLIETFDMPANNYFLVFKKE